MFFFFDDANFFLSKKYVYVNNNIVTNKFFELKVNDILRLVIARRYLFYIKRIYKFFKKKVRKMKYKNWKNYQQKKPQYLYKHPDYLYNFFFFKIDIPKFLQVDFFTLSVIYLFNQDIMTLKNRIFYKIISFYLLKMYNWKKLN